MVAPDIQQAIEQVGATREEIAKGEAEFVKVRGEALKFRREAERLPVRVKIPKRELLAGGLKERRVRRIELLGRKRFRERTLGVATRQEQAITKEEELFQEQVAPVRAQLAVTEAQIKEGLEWELAEKYQTKDRFPFFEPKSVQRKWAMLQKRQVTTITKIAPVKQPSKIIVDVIRPPKKSFWEPFGRIIKSAPPFSIFFRGKTFSPPALTSHVAGMRVPIVSGSPSSLLPQEAHTVPHLESAGTQPIFTVGNTRNPRTWMNKDPLPQQFVKKIIQVTGLPSIQKVGKGAIGATVQLAEYAKERKVRIKEIKKIRALPPGEYAKRFPKPPLVVGLPPEQQFQREIVTPTMEKYQRKVTAGELSITQATRQYEKELQPQIEKYVTTETQKRQETLRLRELYKPTALAKLQEKTLIAETFKKLPSKETIFGTPKEVMVSLERARMKVPEFIRPSPITTPILATAPIGVTAGAYKFVRTEPITVGALAGIGALVPPAIAGAGWALRATKLAKPLAPVVKTVVPVIRYGLPTAYVGLKGVEVVRAPTFMQKGEVIGRAGVEVGAVTAGAVLGTRLASRVASKEMIAEALKKLPKKKQQLYKQYIEDIVRIEREGTVPAKKITLKGLERIPAKARKPIINYLIKYSKEGDILGGSIAMRSQMYGRALKGRSFKGSDLDLYTKGSEVKRAQQLAKILREAGIKRVSTVGGKITIGGKKAIEYHTIDVYRQNIYQAEGWFKPVATTITKTPKGIRIMKIGTQAKRKLIGAWLQGRYERDYPDFRRIVKSLGETVEVKPSLWAEKRAVLRPQLVTTKPKVTVKPFKPFVDIKGLEKIKYPIGLYQPYKPPTPPPYFLPLPSPKITPYAVSATPVKFTPYFPKAPPTRPTIYTPTIKAPPYFPAVPQPYLKLAPPTRPLPYPTPIQVIKPTPPAVPPKEIAVFKPARKVEKFIEVPAYRTFVKRKGKRVFLAGVTPRGRAIRRGERQTRQTLRATFGIVEAGKLPVRRRAPEFLPSPKVFRTYQIIKGKRVPLKDTWIQKAPYRLSARGEVREIQVAKKTQRRKGGRRVRWL